MRSTQYVFSISFLCCDVLECSCAGLPARLPRRVCVGAVGMYLNVPRWVCKLKFDYVILQHTPVTGLQLAVKNLEHLRNPKAHVLLICRP